MTNLKVRDLVAGRPLFTVFPTDNLAVVNQMMFEKKIRHLPVIDKDDGTLQGIISQRDLIKHGLFATEELSGQMQEDFLSKTRVNFAMVRDVETVDIDLNLEEAADLMIENKFGCLPVLEDDHLVGILTESDFVQFVRRQLLDHNRKSA